MSEISRRNSSNLQRSITLFYSDLCSFVKSMVKSSFPLHAAIKLAEEGVGSPKLENTGNSPKTAKNDDFGPQNGFGRPKSAIFL